MSGWSFLSKAEGFLDRVLDEQQKDKSALRNPSRKPDEVVSTPELGSVTRVATPVHRWQDRLTRAASQFTSTDSLPTNVTDEAPGTHVVQALPIVNALVNVEQGNASTQLSVPSAGTVQHALATEISNITVLEALTELQMSNTFPATMPTDIPEVHHSSEPDKLDHVTLALLADVSGRATPSLQSSELQIDTKVSSELPRPRVSRDGNKSSSRRPDLSNIDKASLLAMVYSLQADMQACESRRIDEFSTSAERISALERRLAYFSSESVSSNLDIANSTASSAEQKLLAEKDARIALLLGEGDSLSKKEVQHLANLKKLRTRIGELEGLIASSVKAIEKADQDNVVLRTESKAYQDSVKRAESKLKDLTNVEVEVASLKTVRISQTKQINDLKRQLSDADDTISQNVTIWTQLQAEKAKSDTLQKRIGSLLTEAKTTAEEHGSEIAELQGKLDRLNTRHRSTEADRLADTNRLETEIESLRATLEESTTNSSESSQAKFLRQIESLQTQQSLARQNWARIEESLVLRCNHAEKERDELRAEEENMRQRMRQNVLSKKAVEEERSKLENKTKILENAILDLQDRIDDHSGQFAKVMATLDAERQKWLTEKETMNVTFENRLQERLAQEGNTYQSSAPQSPFLQGMGSRSGYYPFQRHVPDSPNMTRTPDKRPSAGSRVPTHTSRISVRRKPSYQFSTFEDLRSPPLLGREEDPFTPEDGSSQLQPYTEASISTASAGANVGMMERVSANVRKLELEMGILREDLARMTTQRDEARGVCVEMEALEQERQRALNAAQEMEVSRQKMQSKFEATLELLGEQTEENEQLKEDIVDMRKAFRETIEGMHT